MRAYITRRPGDDSWPVAAAADSAVAGPALSLPAMIAGRRQRTLRVSTRRLRSVYTFYSPRC